MINPGKTMSFYGMKPTKTQQRLVHKQIEKWIAREQSLLLLPSEISYDVTIEKEPGLPLSTCHLHIRIGPRTWESHESGKTSEHALIHAIEHLHSSWVEVQPRFPHINHSPAAA